MPVPPQLAGLGWARQDTFDLAAPLSQRQLDFSPGRGKWSAGEVLDHLSRTDRIFHREIGDLVALARSGRRPVLKRGFADLDVAVSSLPKALRPLLDLPFTLMSRLLPRAVSERMAANRKLHIRNPTPATPQPGRPAAELDRDLRASFGALESLVTQNADLDYSALVHHHPLFGVNDVLQILAFITQHERRHQAQIRDVLASPAFPRAEP